MLRRMLVGAARKRLLAGFAPVQVWLRAKKLALFLQLTGEKPAGSLLDVGGDRGVAGEFAELYASFSRVTAVNLYPLTLDAPTNVELQTAVADGCALPFDSRTFDWVFSNAVIEHVGGWDRQVRFANEIRRVAKKGYFVATPNRYFPLEPHTLLPFYQFLTPALQRHVVHFSPGYETHWVETNMLSSRQLRQLFPEAQIRHVGFPLFPNSLVAFYKGE